MSHRLIFDSFIKISRNMHLKCRNNRYPGNDGVDRAVVADNQVSWKTLWVNYKPTCHTSRRVFGQVWADPQPGADFNPKWNELDGAVNRVSFTGVYEIINSVPRNPMGRTGISGRGLLGRWGPNHAADPIVTRWRQNGNNRELEFIAIQRRDCQQWAIPGGMVDPGETVTQTLLREFQEEAINTTNPNLDTFFANGAEIFKGYVDDPRNTDNAWIETVAVNFHDNDNSILNSLRLEAGDDAQNVRWMTVNSSLNLYASHRNLLKTVAEKHNAQW